MPKGSERAITVHDINMMSEQIVKLFDTKIDNLKEHVDNRIDMTEKLLNGLMKNSIEANEMNHELLHKNIKDLDIKLFEVKSIAMRTEEHANKTNGRVTTLERKVDGEKDTNGNIIKQGIIRDLDEIKKYRFIYRKAITPIVITVLMAFLFIIRILLLIL